LEPIIGTRTRVAEVLNRKRGLSIDMIRRLDERLGISVDVLIRLLRLIVIGSSIPMSDLARWPWVTQLTALSYPNCKRG